MTLLQQSVLTPDQSGQPSLDQIYGCGPMSCPVIDPALVEVLRTFLKDYVIIKKHGTTRIC